MKLSDKFEIKRTIIINGGYVNQYLVMEKDTQECFELIREHGLYYAIGIGEEEAKRKVIKYECEPFFTKDNFSYIDTLVWFGVFAMLSST